MIKLLHLNRTMGRIAAALLIVLLSSTIALSQTLTFAVVGDTGQPNKALNAITQQMSNYHTNKARLEFVLLLGDNIYSNGIGDGLAVHFERPFKGLLDGGVKFYAVLGNHDIQEPEGIQMQTTYPLFNMGGRRFYSFKAADGLVEFFALDSTALSKEAEKLVEINLKRLMTVRDTTTQRLEKLGPTASKAIVSQQEKTLAAVNAKISESDEFLNEVRKVRSEQLQWLDEALAGSSAQWKIVFLHHALFSSAYFKGHGRDSEVLKLRKMLNEKFVQHKVDVVFGGHDHVFEKTKVQVSPVTKHKITYITSGAGSKLRTGDLDKTNSFFEFGEDRKNSFLVVHLGANQMEVDVVDNKGKNIFPRFSIAK